MNFDTTLGIIGTLLGIAGMAYAIKVNRRTEITFFENTTISLFQSIVKNLGDIEVSYLGKKINQNLILLKGTIFNSGNVDIGNSSVHKPLEIELPAGYKWVKFRLIENSDHLTLTHSVSTDQKVLIEWDILKQEEFFTFDSLIEVETPENKSPHFKFNHRIDGLKSIQRKSKIIPPASLVFVLVTCAIVFSISLFLGYVSYKGFTTSPTEVLKQERLNGNDIYIKVIEQRNGGIHYYNESGVELGTLNQNDLKKIEGKLKVLNLERNYPSAVTFLIMFVLGVCLLINFILVQLKSRKLYRKIKSLSN